MRKIETQKAKHSQLKDILVDDITGNRYPIGARFPSELDLMRQYEVSNTTLHKALTELVHEGYIYREKGKGTFVADHRRANRLKDKRIIGFIALSSAMFGGAIFDDMYSGIQDSLRNNDCELIFRASDDVVEEEVQHIEQLSDITDGLIIFPSAKANTLNITLTALSKLQERRLPFVLIDRYIERLNSNYVVTDNFTGMYMAVGHLFELGHKSVALLLHDDWSQWTSMLDRKRGYDQAIADFGMKQSLGNMGEAMLVFPREAYSNAGYERIVDSILRVNGKASAVVTAEYHLAVGVIEAALRMGLKVPEELAVVGFDEYPIPGHCPPVGITTVLQPMYDIGTKAMDILVRQMENVDKGIEKLVLKPRLEVRESCGAGLVSVG